ncbi:glycolate oxidase [Agromyces rhizosphaerae]|uniref:Glycolate oxidase n=1 Tax=Agromyces rhizosphaerae TaxID=88374 RepID=A0A9W6CS81_9MICO|nr:FAD-linked oxidase C-terminal domain-containing protein [Agromyces rhizosphaerae]GLI25879.1 glycolate oxidase [Agromyces rhizosphaerae]
MGSDLIDELRRALGDAVSTDDGVREAARGDASGWRTDSPPDAVVHAASVADVQAVLRIASASGTPVVTRGAGTGLAGGANGCRGQIVLDTTRMDRVLEIDQANELAVVEPGVINDDLNRALAPHGLWYSPDPASKAISTIGGNIATGAGGLLCAKYGVTREAVLGLVVVLADGSLLRTGHRTVKGVTGYDLTALLTGSEGTLGVIVEATLRLRPAPRHEPVTIAAAYPDVESAAEGAAAVVRAHLRPAMLELLEPGGLARIRSFLGDAALAGTPLAAGAAPDGAAFLIAQSDGPEAAAEAAEVAAALASAGGSVALAADAAEGERLLAIRRSFHGALAASGEVLIEDVSVPRSQMPAMFREIARIADAHDLEIPTVAHAGDGNLHPNFVYSGDEVPERVWAAADELFRTAVALGGTLTGEHGVGVLKRRWLRDELGDAQEALQRRIKAAFDPAGILNPAAMFEPVA